VYLSNLCGCWGSWRRFRELKIINRIFVPASEDNNPYSWSFVVNESIGSYQSVPSRSGSEASRRSPDHAERHASPAKRLKKAPSSSRSGSRRSPSIESGE
jgi:hypothetical protein